MTTQQLSLEAYNNILEIGSGRRALIYHYIRKNPHQTAGQIMRGLGFFYPNQVRPRITELFKFGFIQESGIIKCPVLRNRATTWEVVE